MPDRRYRALLIGNWHYPEDPANLPDLKGPLNDVSRLAELLASPGTGLFAPADVAALTERASYEITAELEHFFADASRTDVLFVYYSGHGLTADDGSLLLCGRNARTDRKLASTVSAETIGRMMRACAAAAIVIVLDCCHAGAFKTGEFAADLAGKGRFVLASSRSRDRAPDAEHDTGLSRFTGHLLRGLRGEALALGSDHITLSDLYRYVHRKMVEEGPIIPQRRFDGDGDIALARSVVVAPGVVAPPSAGLAVSETLIDLGEVQPGQALPVERVYVTARGPDGSPAPWRAETEADWVALALTPEYLALTLAPTSPRANVFVHNVLTGETRAIRIVARLSKPAPPATPPVAPTAEVRVPRPKPPNDAITVARWYERVGTAVEAGEALGDLFLGEDMDEELPIFAPIAGVIQRIYVASGVRVQVGEQLALIGPGPPREGPPAGPPDEIVLAVLREHEMRLGIQIGADSRAARLAGGRVQHAWDERIIAVIPMSASDDGFVFTTVAMYTPLYMSKPKVLHYRDFPNAAFAARGGPGLARLDLGDGKPRHVGRLAFGMLDLLIDIQADLESAQG